MATIKSQYVSRLSAPRKSVSICASTGNVFLASSFAIQSTACLQSVDVIIPLDDASQLPEPDDATVRTHFDDALCHQSVGTGLPELPRGRYDASGLPRARGLIRAHTLRISSGRPHAPDAQLHAHVSPIRLPSPEYWHWNRNGQN